MKRYTIGALVAVFALAFALVGCGSAQSVDKETLKGFWILDESAQLGFDAALNLDEGDEEGAIAELMISDSYLEGKWETDGKKATITFDDNADKPATIFVTNGKLTLGQADGSRLVFKKGDMDSYFAAQDEAAGSAQVIDLADGSTASAEVVEEVIEDVKPVVLADNDTCTITLTGKGTDFTGDPGYRLSVLNKTKKAIYVTTDDTFKVGDKEIEPGLGEVIEAGKTTETFLYFPKDDLGGGVDALKNITGKIIVGDDDSGDEIETMSIKID